MKRQCFCFVILLSVFGGTCATGFSAETAGDLPKIQEGYEGCDADLAPLITKSWRPAFKLYFENSPNIHHSGTFSRDGRLFAVTVMTGAVISSSTFVYDLVEKKNIAWIANPERPPLCTVNPVAFSSDNKYLLFGGKHDLVAWNLRENKEERRFPVPRTTYERRDIPSSEYEKRGSYEITECPTSLTFIEFLDNDKKVRAWQKNDFQTFYKGGSLSKNGEEFHFLWNFQTGRSIEVPDQPIPLVYSQAGYAGGYPRANTLSDDHLIQARKIRFFNHERIEFVDHRVESLAGSIPLAYYNPGGNDNSGRAITEFLFLPNTHVLMTATIPVAYPPDRKKQRGEDWLPTIHARVVPKMEKPSQTFFEFWDCDDLIWDMYQANLFPKRIRAIYLEGEDILVSGVLCSQGQHVFFKAGTRKYAQFLPTCSYGYIFSLDFEAEPDETVELFPNPEVKVTLLNIPDEFRIKINSEPRP